MLTFYLVNILWQFLCCLIWQSFIFKYCDQRAGAKFKSGPLAFEFRVLQLLITLHILVFHTSFDVLLQYPAPDKLTTVSGSITTMSKQPPTFIVVVTIWSALFYIKVVLLTSISFGGVFIISSVFCKMKSKKIALGNES